jgi:cell division protein FtsN
MRCKRHETDISRWFLQCGIKMQLSFRGKEQASSFRDIFQLQITFYYLCK